MAKILLFHIIYNRRRGGIAPSIYERNFFTLEIGLIGSDRRQEVAAAFLNREGILARTLGTADEMRSCPFLVLPYPVTRDGSTVAGTTLTLAAVAERAGVPLFGGRVPALLREGRWVYDVEEDEVFLRQNAYLTAAAGVATALRAGERAFFRVSAAVLGYGRIGKETANMLRALGADTRVYVRRAAARDEARAAGFPAFLFSEVTALDESLVLGTVPAPAENLAALRFAEGASVYDLGGGLPNAVKTTNGETVAVLSLRGAPALFAPRAAGEIYGAAVLRALSAYGRENIAHPRS